MEEAGVWPIGGSSVYEQSLVETRIDSARISMYSNACRNDRREVSASSLPSAPVRRGGCECHGQYVADT